MARRGVHTLQADYFRMTSYYLSLLDKLSSRLRITVPLASCHQGPLPLYNQGPQKVLKTKNHLGPDLPFNTGSYGCGLLCCYSSRVFLHETRTFVRPL